MGQNMGQNGEDKVYFFFIFAVLALLVGGVAGGVAKGCSPVEAGDLVYGTTHTTHTTHVTPSKRSDQPKVESFKPNPFWKWFLGK
mgnify:CR=1 FL=1